MAQDAALAIIQTLHTQTAALARSIVTALSDKKISTWETMQISMQGMQLAAYTMMMLQGLDAATKKDILDVLEKGTWSLPQLP